MRLPIVSAVLWLALSACAYAPTGIEAQARTEPSSSQPRASVEGKNAEGKSAEGKGAATRTVFVLAHELHAGLAVRPSEVPAGVWPALADFPDANYLELGWGDREYYIRPDPGVWLGLRALFWPTASTIHVVGVRGTLEHEFPGSEIAAVRVSEEGFARLVAFITDSHERDSEGRTIVLAPGQRPNARFYASNRRFHMFETCNTWVARALQAGGIDIDPASATTAGALMQQVRAVADQKNAR